MTTCRRASCAWVALLSAACSRSTPASFPLTLPGGSDGHLKFKVVAVQFLNVPPGIVQ